MNIPKGERGKKIIFFSVEVMVKYYTNIEAIKKST